MAAPPDEEGDKQAADEADAADAAEEADEEDEAEEAEEGEEGAVGAEEADEEVRSRSATVLASSACPWMIIAHTCCRMRHLSDTSGLSLTCAAIPRRTISTARSRIIFLRCANFSSSVPTSTPARSSPTPKKAHSWGNMRASCSPQSTRTIR